MIERIKTPEALAREEAVKKLDLESLKSKIVDELKLDDSNFDGITDLTYKDRQNVVLMRVEAIDKMVASHFHGLADKCKAEGTLMPHLKNYEMERQLEEFFELAEIVYKPIPTGGYSVIEATEMAQPKIQEIAGLYAALEAEVEETLGTAEADTV